MANCIRQAKAALRSNMKTKLQNLTDQDRRVQSQIVTDKALSCPEYESSKRVSVFLSMESEINTERIVAHLLDTHRECFVPYYKGPVMKMLKLNSMEDLWNLPETKWHIKQPSDDKGRDDALETGGLDLMFMPGVAFSSEGARCGHGRGYYDNYLRQCREKGFKPFTIGLAYLEQICESVPVSDDDVKIDKVLYSSAEEIQRASSS
ncbi:5-formyltetrahydrofolate cyclo-ligase-like [Gigantopelta aegis]|uniref:5-formyltetrahydrofolate cyclo-ligase-like n=1 Tax=Gigantopelta aegis TaxID=1735272 RepID=UPI001B88A2F3|nr:5-formyltetrahydrofolate cyclo-ligase-like [Gigantopelta aegis]